MAIISTQVSNTDAGNVFRNNDSMEDIIKCKQLQRHDQHEVIDEMQLALDKGVKCSPMNSHEYINLLEASMEEDSTTSTGLQVSAPPAQPACLGEHFDLRPIYELVKLSYVLQLFIDYGSRQNFDGEINVVNNQFCAGDLKADVKADQENELAIILIIAVVNVGSLVMCCSVPSIINHDDRVQNVPEKEWVFPVPHFMPVVRNGARVELTLTPAHADSEKNEVVYMTPKFMPKYNPLAMDVQDGSLLEPGLINATSTLAHEDDETFSMTDPENNDYVYTDNVKEILNVNPQMANGNYLVTLWFMY